MRYAQYHSGNKLHLVYEPGEGYGGEIVRAGYLSWPLCGTRVDSGYRMTINVPLRHACRKCLRIYEIRTKVGDD